MNKLLVIILTFLLVGCSDGTLLNNSINGHFYDDNGNYYGKVLLDYDALGTFNDIETGEFLIQITSIEDNNIFVVFDDGTQRAFTAEGIYLYGNLFYVIADNGLRFFIKITPQNDSIRVLTITPTVERGIQAVFIVYKMQGRQL